MKRLIGIISCLVIGLCLLAFVGCGSNADKYTDSPYLGQWEGNEAEYVGVKMTVTEIIGGAFAFTLNDDGTASVEVAGTEFDGTWEPEDKGVNLKYDSEDLDFKDKDGTLMVETKGVTMYFEKKGE